MRKHIIIVFCECDIANLLFNCMLLEGIRRDGELFCFGCAITI